MKAYKVEVLVLDFENYGEEQIAHFINDIDGASCTAMKIQSVEIGRWEDSNPLNSSATHMQEFARLFPG